MYLPSQLSPLIMLRLAGEGSESYTYRPSTTMRSPSTIYSPKEIEYVRQSSYKPSTKAKVTRPEDTLPTPRPSIDSHTCDQRRREELLGNVRDLCRKVIDDPMNEVRSISGVDEKDFMWLKEKAEAGEIPDWESIRLAHKDFSIILDSMNFCRTDFMNNVIIVKCPTWLHESLNHVVFETIQGHSHQRIRLGGAPDVNLLKNLGSKCPDIVLCDKNDQDHDGFPTVAFEVGYTQTQADLNFVAARLLFGSGGKINAVVTAKVDVKDDKIQFLGIDVWRMTAKYKTGVEVEGIKRGVILTKENKLADPSKLSWFFSFVVEADDTLFQLKVKPIRYQVSRLTVTIDSYNSDDILDLSQE